MKFVEIANGQPSNRGYVCPINEYIKYIKPKNEVYRSYYAYDEEIVEHFKIKKTVKGFIGKYYLPEIVIDIDKGKTSDDDVLFRARLFVQKLEDEWKLDRNQLEIYYSGTGYHVVFPDIFHFEPSNDLPDEVKMTFQRFFPEMDTIPLMKPGLIRVPLSFNIKSSRYKIRLRIEEFFNLKAEDIIKFSEQPREVIILDDNDYDVPDFKHLIVKSNGAVSRDEFREEPTRIVTCVQKMYNEGAIPGTRHVNMLRIVGAWRKSGLPIGAVKALLKIWANGTLSDYEINKQVNYLWDKGYTPGCKDEIMSKYCDPKCVFYTTKDFVPMISDSETMEKKFRDFIRKDFSTTSFDMNEFFDLPEGYRIYPGELVIIFGDTKIGKSTLAQNLCIGLKRMRILYLSLEVNERLMFRRFIQIEKGMTKNQVIDHYQKDDYDEFSKDIQHIQMMETSPDIDSVKRIITSVQPKLVVIDTIDGLKVPNVYDGTGKTEQLAIQLKQLAQTLNVIIIGVHHISKKAAVDEEGIRKELTVHSGKGSSAVEQKADRIIGVMGDPKDTLRRIKSLGTRDDTDFEVYLHFDFDTFRMSQLKQGA